MFNYKQLIKKIPSRVQIDSNTTYEICWVDEFEEPDILGLSRSSTKQILIKKNLSPKLTIEVYLHELIHSFSDSNESSITESQIKCWEKSFYYLLKKGNIFK